MLLAFILDILFATGTKYNFCQIKLIESQQKNSVMKEVSVILEKEDGQTDRQTVFLYERVLQIKGSAV